MPLRTPEPDDERNTANNVSRGDLNVKFPRGQGDCPSVAQQHALFYSLHHDFTHLQVSEDVEDTCDAVTSSYTSDEEDTVKSTDHAMTRQGKHRQERPVTSLNNMPHDVMVQIVSHLESYSDLVSFMQVKRSWLLLGAARVWQKPSLSTPTKLRQVTDVLRSCRSHTSSANYAKFVQKINLIYVSKDLADMDLLSFERCTNTHRFIIAHAPLITPAALQRLFTQFKQLQTLDIQNVSAFNDGSCHVLGQRCPDLQNLLASGDSITNRGLAALAKSQGRSLRRVRLSNYPRISPRGIVLLARRLPLLLELGISGLHCFSLDLSNDYRRDETPPVRLDSEAPSETPVSETPSEDVPSEGSLVDEEDEVAEQQEEQEREDDDDDDNDDNDEEDDENLDDVLEELTSSVVEDIPGFTDDELFAVLTYCTTLRELRLNGCPFLSKTMFSPWCSGITIRRLDALRVVSLATCPQIADSTLMDLVHAAPRLRHLNLSKCPLITDRGLGIIARAYNNSLNYLHVGHCVKITDRGVAFVVYLCPRLTFFDAANCVNLTNLSMGHLACLSRLRRVGVVKCHQIGSEGVAMLVRKRDERDSGIRPLERLHLSYCTSIDVPAVKMVVDACPNLVHLSLTGVRAFLRQDIQRFSRPPPAELSMHQQEVFCVFSGSGVADLRHLLSHIYGPTETAPPAELRVVVRFSGPNVTGELPASPSEENVPATTTPTLALRLRPLAEPSGPVEGPD